MLKTPVYIFSFAIIFLLSSTLEARTFKIATILPDGTVWMDKLRNGAKVIQEKTNNRVKFKFYTGGVMGSDKSMLKKMRIGQLHGGAITGGGLAHIDPGTQIYSLPFMFHNLNEVDFVRKTVDPLIVDGLQKKGLITLGISEGGFAYFMSSYPVRTVEDLKKLKNWVPEGDNISQTMYETVGITPVPLGLADVYTGLQTGLIDTVGSNPTGAIAFQWHTKLKYVTDIPLIYIIGAFVMDAKAFDKIKPEDQVIVKQVMSEVFKELNAINRASDLKARAALKQQGLEFIKPTDAEIRHWRELAVRMIEKMGEKGIYTQNMYNSLTSLLKDYRSKKQ